MSIENPREFMLQLFHTAVESVRAENCLPSFLADLQTEGRTIVIGAGKAAAAMAATVERHWQGELSGLVVTPYGHGAACKKIEVVEAAHPVPDGAGQQAAQRILDLVQGQQLTEKDVVLCLISGGGSALLSLPAAGITLEQKRAVNKALLKSGAAIHEMNCVRKHLSRIKGGRLALACAPARVVSFLISDVPGDDPSVIASGPTLPDSSTSAEALAILKKYNIAIDAEVLQYLESAESETPKPHDPRFAEHEHHVICNAATALEAAAAASRAQGMPAYILSDSIEGEARDVAQVLAAIARQVADREQPFSTPCVLLSGGETTVTVRGSGRGGRNAEFLLSAAIALNGHKKIFALACDTDGIDGSETNAGALYTPDSLARAEALGLKPKEFLNNNDAFRFFEALGDLVVTQPTRTNVNDFRALLIL